MIDKTSLRKAERHLENSDPRLRSLVRRVGRCRLDEMQRPRAFETLAQGIVSQQLSNKAAATIYRRFVRLLGRRYPNPESILSKSAAELREAGISKQKSSYLHDLARKVADGTLSLRRLPHLSDEEAVRELTQVKGIGPWTAEVYLIFNLGRLDVLPVGDLGIRDSVKMLYGMRDLPDEKRLRRVAEPWRPYRSVACWYLWMGRGMLGEEHPE